MTQLRDVVVIGAGPSGLALACALSDAGMSVTVVERAEQSSLADPAPDGRDIALTHRGRSILESLGIWEYFPENEVAPLREARVLNGTSSFFLEFDTRGSGKQELGYLVANNEIRRACHRAATGKPGVEILAGVAVTDVLYESAMPLVRLADKRELRAKLVVAADSRFSDTRRKLGIGADMTDFGRSVIVARLAHDRDNEGVAYECFHYGRTLALLPLNGRQVSSVVTVTSDRATALMKESAQDYADMVHDQFDGRLGAMTMQGERHLYPLVAVYARRFVADRFALIGDAAVGMHPVTAHGYNFGLYGVDALVRAIQACGGDPGAAGALARYESEHRRATLPIYLGTNALVRLFTDDSMPARAVRSAVLRVANLLPPVKAGITRQLTGSRLSLPIPSMLPNPFNRDSSPFSRRP